jgi:hypothetical protein
LFPSVSLDGIHVQRFARAAFQAGSDVAQRQQVEIVLAA